LMSNVCGCSQTAPLALAIDVVLHIHCGSCF